MELKELEIQFAKVCNDLMQGKENLFLASESTIKAREELEAAKTLAILGEKLDGKNAEIRKAQENDLLKQEIGKLSEAERGERTTRAQLDVLQIQYDLLCKRLRIYELAASQGEK